MIGLVKFTSQGDNSEDAKELADYLNQWLMVKQVLHILPFCYIIEHHMTICSQILNGPHPVTGL